MSGLSTQILDRVCRALDCMVAAAQPYQGLIPSIMDRQTGAMLAEMPDAIEGQRNSDRAFQGSNLIHDQVTLRTMYALAVARDRSDYADAADAYLNRFATHCTDTATGLFPWGEHSFWHLIEDGVGNSYLLNERSRNQPATHDHLRQTPPWLWEKLHSINPSCIERFAEGLDYHWQEGKRVEYIRHARIEEKSYPKPGSRSCDFPRHGGFYILDWAYAWSKTGRNDFLDQIRTMLNYWWNKRDDRDLLLIESRSPEEDVRFHNVNAPAQTVSLAVSLLESARLLESVPELSADMLDRAQTYINGFFAAPHDLEKGVYVILSRRDDNTVAETMPIWGSRYGVWPASYVALTCLCGYRLTQDGRLLQWAEAAGRGYMKEPFPTGTAVPAMDSGLGLGLLADLYVITGEGAWLEGALEVSETLMKIYFDDAPLPRGAAGADWYESQMGPGFLLHGLARTALLADGATTCPLDADYTTR